MLVRHETQKRMRSHDFHLRGPISVHLTYLFALKLFTWSVDVILVDLWPGIHILRFEIHILAARAIA